jgi:RHS repeat-associated protein
VLNRVTREKRFTAASVLSSDIAFTYDAAGNMASAGPVASPVTYSYNADSQLLSGGGVSYSFDNAGRRVGEHWVSALGVPQSVQYGWDARDRLLSYRDSNGLVTQYQYDDNGVRLGKSSALGFTRNLVDRESLTGYSQLVRRERQGGVDQFVWGQDLLSANESTVTRYPLFDTLGNTRQLTTSVGAVSDQFDYKAYGERINTVGASSLPHRFTGEETDEESGLTHLRARFYDPRSGQMLSRDALSGYWDEPLSLNPYLYVAGNPVNRTDPSGNDFSIQSTLFASAQSLALRGPDLLNKRRGLVKAKEVDLISARLLGGIMAIESVIEDLGGTGGGRVNTWFGGGKAVRRAIDVLEAANPAFKAVDTGIHVIANLFMAVTAFKMLDGEKVVFYTQAGFLLSASIDETTRQLTLPATASTDFANAKCSLAAGQKDPIARAFKRLKPQAVLFCAKYFLMPILPTAATLRAAGKASQPGVMLHEFTHLATNTKDAKYQCTKSGVGSLTEAFTLNKVPGVALYNADSYRCWGEDTAIGSPIIPKSW